jgi:putative FmdB family regulatory protein
MPSYQYRCEKCGKRFERTETISEHEAARPQCPKCGSKKVTFVPGPCVRDHIEEELKIFKPLRRTLSAAPPALFRGF